MNTYLKIFLCLLTGVGLAVPCGAQEIGAVGISLLASKEKLNVKGCGKETYGRFLYLEFLDDGTWKGETDDLIPYSGTYVEEGKGKIVLTLDPASQGTLMALMGWKARLLCEHTTVAVLGKQGLIEIKGKIRKEKIKIKLKMDFETGPMRKGKVKAKFKGTFVPFKPSMEVLNDE